MRSKYLIVFCLAFLVLFSLIVSASEQERYYGVVAWPQHDYWQPIWQGARDAAEWLGVDFQVKGSMEYTAEGVVNALEQVLARDPSGIIMSGAACTPEALQPHIDRAVDSGVPVVMFDSDCPISKRYSFIGADDRNLGSIAADTLASIVEEETGKIEGQVVIEYTPGALNLEMRVQGFSETLAEKYPGLELIAKVDDEGQAATGQTRVGQLLASKPGIVGLYGVHATAAIGMGAAVKEADCADRVAVVTMDATEPALELAEKGMVDAIISQNNYHMGFWSMVMAYTTKNSISAPIDDWQKAGISPAPAWVDPGCNVITEENIDKFLK